MGKKVSLRATSMSTDRPVFRFSFDGNDYEGLEGDTVASALWAAGVRVLRFSPEQSAPRGAFCFMGSCQECVVETDIGLVEACRLVASPGLIVRRVAYAD